MQEQRLTGRTIALYLATYAGWLAHCAAGVAICILWQQTLLLLYARAGWNKYGASAYNNLIVIVLVLGWLVLCIGTEAWYRHGIANGTIGRRLLRVTLIEIAAAALAFFGGLLIAAMA
jgi:hypothetical protein